MNLETNFGDKDEKNAAPLGLSSANAIEELMRKAILRNRKASQEAIQAAKDAGQLDLFAQPMQEAGLDSVRADALPPHQVVIESEELIDVEPVAGSSKRKTGSRKRAETSDDLVVDGVSAQMSDSHLHESDHEVVLDDDDEIDVGAYSRSDVDAYEGLTEEQVHTSAHQLLDQGASRGSSSSQMYLNKLGRYELLSTEEANELIYKSQAGDKAAFEKLFNHNLRLVVFVARKFLNRGMDFDDLIQEGGLGLMRGLEKFNPEVGVKHSTYLTFWIRQRIRRSLDGASIVHTPTYLRDRASALYTKAKEAKKSGSADAQELQAKSDEAINQIHNASGANAQSLSAKAFGDESATTLEETLVDDSENIEETIAHRQTINLFLESLKELPERERFIVAAKCDLLGDYADELELEGWIDSKGLCDYVESLQELPAGATVRGIGAALGISGERVNQLFNNSMKAIKEEIGYGVGGLDNLSFDVNQSDKKAKASASP